MKFKEALKYVREQLDRTPDGVLSIFKSLPDSHKHDSKALLQGFKVEIEHVNTVGGNAHTIAKIVLDHLAEDPKYYEKLSKAGL